MQKKVLKSEDLSILQAKADLQIVEQILQALKDNSGNGKYLRGLAAYHLQQATEKLIKIQIYVQVSKVDYHKMYDHKIDQLIKYGNSQGAVFNIPNDIVKNALSISLWEANGRYDLHIVTRITTIKKYFDIMSAWYDELYSEGYR